MKESLTYSTGEVSRIAKATLIRQMRSKMISLQSIRKILVVLEKVMAAIAADGAGGCWIVTDGINRHVAVSSLESLEQYASAAQYKVYVLRVRL